MRGVELLSVVDLDVTYRVGGLRKREIPVLRGVSITIEAGQTFGLVGESGSGKSTLGRAILGLAPVTGGSIRLGGRTLVGLRGSARRRVASDVQAVFQDPYSSLNPSMSIADTLSEPLQRAGASGRDARAQIKLLLDRVGLPADAGQRLPREFSGGQRQRIAIARAIALRPKLIVCDEPTSALDLSTQARVLELLVELQRETGVSYLFISHDLGVIRRVSRDVAVMKDGQIVERGRVEHVLKAPEHPYTRRLLLAAPVPHPKRQRARREERWRAQAEGGRE